ncbi:MAG: DNA polymerase III subunit beta [Lachnospiraceae bacterium]|jgi:DNA polymerase-3 subunit beta|nr:DNA polymerase III subunit beta [Lachnospiraceae bacterium]MCH4031681.1 DNA polymerase III subunit beta [Lachnospiraceae bacterium]MCH4069902.1 DNA polymerase III subunit beta [Lachnospiraceae bacterium]MCH4108235.1 DNA polymerase III subunit beta [Lachnospiraceae bacterium]MCI1303062.1 DNA polymerase III subunit beta [Lachnospiraceae bacterium]
MKLSFSKQDLLKGINTVARAVPTHTTMPVLECIFIDASTNQITFTANDTELGISTVTNGTIVEKGTIAINARIFSDIAKKLPDDLISIETDERNTVTITCGSVVFNIPGQSGEEFPYLPAIAKDKAVTLSQFLLKSLIEQTIFCTAPNDNNKMMQGELFEIRNGVLRIAALDGHRIALRTVELEGAPDDEKVIVPGKTLQEVARILGSDTDSKVDLFFTKNHLMFSFDSTLVVTQLIEGEYFRIQQMINCDYETKVTVSKNDFAGAIDRSTTMIRETERKPIALKIGEDEMEVSANTELGKMNDRIPATVEGEELMIGFNPKFLLDALKVVPDDMVTMYFSGSKRPLFIRDEESSYLYLILPVNMGV